MCFHGGNEFKRDATEQVAATPKKKASKTKATKVKARRRRTAAKA